MVRKDIQARHRWVRCETVTADLETNQQLYRSRNRCTISSIIRMIAGRGNKHLEGAQNYDVWTLELCRFLFHICNWIETGDSCQGGSVHGSGC